MLSVLCQSLIYKIEINDAKSRLPRAIFRKKLTKLCFVDYICPCSYIMNHIS